MLALSGSIQYPALIVVTTESTAVEQHGLQLVVLGADGGNVHARLTQDPLVF